VSHLAYLGVLAFVLMGSAWLEIALRTRVLARSRRLLLALLPVAVVFALWDAYAVAEKHWTFDPERTTGVHLATLPLEEVLFFVVVPFAAVLTLEAVRSVKRWEVGDEPPGACVDGVRIDDTGRVEAADDVTGTRPSPHGAHGTDAEARARADGVPGTEAPGAVDGAAPTDRASGGTA